MRVWEASVGGRSPRSEVAQHGHLGGGRRYQQIRAPAIRRLRRRKRARNTSPRSRVQSGNSSSISRALMSTISMKADGSPNGALALGMLRTAAVLALVALPFAARAQTSTPGTDPGPNISPAVGVHYGSPLRASGAFGMLVDFNGSKNDGIIVLAELG